MRQSKLRVFPSVIFLFLQLPVTLALSGCGKALDVRVAERGIYRIVTFKHGATTKDLLDPGSGTGFLVGKRTRGRSVVVTNLHVVEKADEIYVGVIVDGNPKLIPADIIEADKKKDLALLQTDEAAPGKPFDLAEYTPTDSAIVSAIGFPSAADIGLDEELVNAFRQAVETHGDIEEIKKDEKKFARAISDGVRSASLEFERQMKTKRTLLTATKTGGHVSRGEVEGRDVIYVQHSAPISKGSSGGPLLDECGIVVGVNTLGSSAGIHSSVSAGDLIEFMSDHNFAPQRRESPCNFANFHLYMPYVVAIAAVLLSFVALLFAFRRNEVVRRSYTAISRVSRSPRADVQSSLTTSPPARPPPGADSALKTRSGGRRRSRDDTGLGGAMTLVSLGSTRSLPLPLEVLKSSRGAIVGRGKDCDGVIDSSAVSKRHARLLLDRAGNLEVEDLGSSNGTFKGAAKISRDVFRAGDTIRFGQSEFRIELPGDGGRSSVPAGKTVLSARDYGSDSGSGSGPAHSGYPAQLREPSSHSGSGRPTVMLSGVDEQGKIVQMSLRPRSDASQTEWVIGRKAGKADHVIAHSTVSSQHARIRHTPNRGLEICDLGSSNGTQIDAMAVGRDFVSMDGAKKVTFGGVEMSVSRT